MAKKKLWLVMLVMVLAFGMTVVGCDTEVEDDSDLKGSVSLNNDYPAVYETITASFSKDSRDPIGSPVWVWYKTAQNDSSLSGVTNKIRIGSGSSYSVKYEDEGFWIWAEVSYSGNNGTVSGRTKSTVIGCPSNATVSVSISARRLVYTGGFGSIRGHSVIVTLTLSNGKWKDISYNTVSRWLTMSGTPSVSSWYNVNSNPSVSARGRELEISYSTTSSSSSLAISDLTATLNTAQLGTMRSSTNVISNITAGTTTATVSQWTYYYN